MFSNPSSFRRRSFLCCEICPHSNAYEIEYGAARDRFGRLLSIKLSSCPPGGEYFIGHDKVCKTHCQLAAGADGIPGVVAAWKPQVDAGPRATCGAEADAGFCRIPGCRDTYVDTVCSYAKSQTYARCESTAGKVAERKANQLAQVRSRWTSKRSSQTRSSPPRASSGASGIARRIGRHVHGKRFAS